VKVVNTYHECFAPSITSSCQTSAKLPGTIKTAPLHGTLVYASETEGGTKVAAQKYTPEKPPTAKEIEEGFTTGLFASFFCGPKAELKVKVSGTIFVEVTPINTEVFTRKAINAERTTAEPFGCGKQKLLYENAIAPCKHLFTKAGVAWNVQENTDTAKTATEVRA